MQVPALLIGSNIEYLVGSGLRKKRKKGVIVDQTDKLLVLDLGRYRDTILKNDLITGEVRITSITGKGENTMAHSKRIEMPSKEYLQELFEKASGNISRAARSCEPQVSDVTMGKWLRAAGIIPANSTRDQVTKEAPPVEELSLAWEEANHKISAIVKKYDITRVIARRWLKAAGIIVEGPKGIETVTARTSIEENNGETEEMSPVDEIANEGLAEAYRQISELATYLLEVAESVERLQNMQDNINSDAGEADHAIIKKLVDFSIAPTIGRIDKLEQSIASLAKLVLDGHKADAAAPNFDLLDNIAELIIRIMGRVANVQLSGNKAQ